MNDPKYTENDAWLEKVWVLVAMKSVTYDYYIYLADPSDTRR